MGRQAKISLLGLYKWDNTLFSLMQIPEGLDLDTLTGNILSETAELEVLYPNPEVMKNLIGIWSAKMIDRWNRLYATTQYEYNPINNYDRTEEYTEQSGDRRTHSGTDTRTTTRNLANSDEHYQAGFDSTADGLVKQYRDSGTDTGTVGDSLVHGEQIADTHNGSHTVRSHGNIGVTTTQKMIREQREVEDYNLYDIIKQEFVERFCILVY